MALSRLKELSENLLVLVRNDSEDFEKAQKQALVIENAIRDANNSARGHVEVDDDASDHPLIARLSITDMVKCAAEDLRDSITTSQTDRARAVLVNAGANLNIPAVPRRAVEDQLSLRGQRCWTINNINLLAPIPPAVWRIWCAFTAAEIKACEELAMNGNQAFKSAIFVDHAFPLYLFDHSKCTVPDVKLHVKFEIPTANDRKHTHVHEMWNVHRPYMRCTCSADAVVGCHGSVIWWDHAIWYMVNNLEKFFPNDRFPSLFGKFIAFLTWMYKAGKMGARAQLCFMHSRNWMMEGALEMAANPKARLFSKYPDMPGFRKVERILKPPSFSVANPARPTHGPPSKRAKINLNADSPESHNALGAPAYGRGNSSSGYRRGAGGWMQHGGRRSSRGGRQQQLRWTSPRSVAPNQFEQRTPPKTPTSGLKPASHLGQASGVQERFVTPQGIPSGVPPPPSGPRIEEIDTTDIAALSPIRPRLLSFGNE